MAYIYKITNDVNGKIYIGKTQFSVEKRFREHCSDSLKERCEKRPLYSAMRKYGIEHFHPELIEETDNPEEREKYWIEYYDSFKNGYNATIGGDGKQYVDYDLVVSTYKELQNIKATSEKLHLDQGHVSNILKSKGVKILSYKEVIQNKVKSVNQYTLNHEYIATYPSASAAARAVSKAKAGGGGPHTAISKCCKGQQKTAYGYLWEYADK